MTTRVGIVVEAQGRTTLAKASALRDLAELLGRALLISVVVGILVTLVAVALP
jgi:hypothetical protein